jgi:hypothetical protein
LLLLLLLFFIVKRRVREAMAFMPLFQGHNKRALDGAEKSLLSLRARVYPCRKCLCCNAALAAEVRSLLAPPFSAASLAPGSYKLLPSRPFLGKAPKTCLTDVKFDGHFPTVKTVRLHRKTHRANPCPSPSKAPSLLAIISFQKITVRHKNDGRLPPPFPPHPHAAPGT